MADQCGHRIMAITSAFQADDAGSIPADRSKQSFSACDEGMPGVAGKHLRKAHLVLIRTIEPFGGEFLSAPL
jgi:hypothetical protein